MIEVRDATQADLDYVRNNPIDDRATKHFMDLQITGWAKTAVLGDKIMGVGGAVLYWPGFAEGWYLVSKDGGESKFLMVHCIKTVIELAIKELNLHRFQSTIRVDFTSAIKLIEHVGFVKEGLLRKYTQDKVDAYIYALVL